MVTKTCVGCKTEKPVDQFWKRPDSLDGRLNTCKMCTNLRSRSYYQRNKNTRAPLMAMSKRRRRFELMAYVYEYLQEHPCIDCGETDFMALEFDHIRDKKYDVSRIMADVLSLQVLKDEISKCVVRCANHHKIITHVRQKTWRWQITQPNWAEEFWSIPDVEED